MGWVAVAAPAGSKLRTEAVELLRAIVAAAPPGNSQQAKYWLFRVAEK